MTTVRQPKRLSERYKSQLASSHFATAECAESEATFEKYDFRKQEQGKVWLKGVQAVKKVLLLQHPPPVCEGDRTDLLPLFPFVRKPQHCLGQNLSGHKITVKHTDVSLIRAGKHCKHKNKDLKTQMNVGGSLYAIIVLHCCHHWGVTSSRHQAVSDH